MESLEYPVAPPGLAETVQRTFEDMLLPLFSEPGARRKVGFHQISRRIPDGSGWFFWLREAPGAFLLELAETPSSNHELSGRSIYAPFVLKYFPAVGEEILSRYSAEEREIRRSDLFDHTGTPAYATRDLIPPEYFSIGYFGALIHPDSESLVLECASQELLLHLGRDGMPQRHLQGWELTRRFFSVLLLGFCYRRLTGPSLVRLLRTPGTAIIADSPAGPRPVERPDISRWMLQASIGMAERPCVLPMPDGEGEVVWDSARAAGKDHPWVDDQWWQAAGWAFEPDEDLCHCCFHDHG